MCSQSTKKMHILLSHRSSTVSKFVRNVPQNPNPFLRSHCPKTSHSLAHNVPSHSPLFFSPSVSTLSWRSQTFHSKKISGSFSGSVFRKLFLVNTLLKVTSGRSLTDFRVGFLGIQIPRRSYLSFYALRRWRLWLPKATSDGVVLGLILANVAVFMLWKVVDHDFMTRHFTITVDNLMSGRGHSMIFSAFSHIKAEHIISNMIGLYFFGSSIGRLFGHRSMLKLYFAGVMGGSLFHLVHHSFLAATSKGREALMTPGLGASGAVDACMLLNLFLFRKSAIYLDFFIPVPAMLLGVVLIGKDMLRIIQGDSDISGSAHLAGAAVAAIAWARIRRGPF